MRTEYKRTEVGVIPDQWDVALLDSVAKRGSGHTPDKAHPEYWGGLVKWISLQDSDRLDRGYVHDTAAKITAAGIANSSAKLHPAGTVVLSRDAGVGKSAIMQESMAVSQHFMAWTCGPLLNNEFLYYWLQANKAEFERIAMGNTIKTIGLPYFRRLSIPLPEVAEQRAIAGALRDADALVESLEQLLAKKRHLKQGAMQELLTGKKRLPGLAGEWQAGRLGELGSTYGGLTGKTKADFGHGAARYITFMNIMSNVVIDHSAFEAVDVAVTESQNRVKKGDLFFNGSSETPDEVGMCSVLRAEVDGVFLNSFCFGFRLRDQAPADGLFLAYYFRSRQGRTLLWSLAQGATRYNLSKTALVNVVLTLPGVEEQSAIAAVLTDMDAEITSIEAKVTKAHQIKQGMMQELLTGRIRLV